MAEGLLGGLAGDEDEKPEVEAPQALAGAEAFAAAIAAKLSGNDPEVAKDTSAFLKKQAQLLEIQAEHLRDEHAIRLHYLRGQAREVDIRRFNLRLRIAFQIFIALAASLIGLGAALFVYDAVTSRSVIIEPFHAPPSLAARGIDGTVLAGKVLDELTRLQDATHGRSAKRSISSAWSNDIKLEVPETGVSIGEISRLLRARFGNDVHIDGDLVEGASGDLTLTVRGDAVQPKSFTGSGAEFGKIVREAAEYAYAKSQPSEWSVYLSGQARYAEQIAFDKAALATASEEDRPHLLLSWANALGATGDSPRKMIELYRAALKLKPDYWAAYNNIMFALSVQGDEEGVWRAGEDLRKAAGGRPGRAGDAYFENWDVVTWNLQARLAPLTADVNAEGGVGGNVASERPTLAAIYAQLHDPAASELMLETIEPDDRDPTNVAGTHYVRGLLALQAGDTLRSVAELEAFASAFSNPVVATNMAGANCWLAAAEEAAGHSDKADAALKAGGHYVDCYRLRGDILDHRGDWVGAQKAYEEAVALAPDLPAAFYSWGEALVRHGDLDGAAAKFKEANLRGPHWADPLKAWADVLEKTNKKDEAMQRYNEALKYAPNWKELKAASEAAGHAS